MKRKSIATRRRTYDRVDVAPPACAWIETKQGGLNDRILQGLQALSACQQTLRPMYALQRRDQGYRISLLYGV